MRRSVKPEQQMDFFLSLIRKEIDHYEIQAETVDRWIHMSILSLKQYDLSLLEGLRDEYKQKASVQRHCLQEFQTTLKMYLDTRNKDHYLNFI